jgi:membrane protein DedA with SNARE-associated domain
MIAALLLAFLVSILENIVLFLVGRVLIYNKLFIEYLRIKQPNQDELAQQKAQSSLIESIIRIIGIVIQIIAIIRTVASLVATLLAMEQIDNSTQRGNL